MESCVSWTDISNRQVHVYYFVIICRQELNDLKSVHGHCGDYENEQSTLIQKLQSLQDETQTGILDKCKLQRTRITLLSVKSKSQIFAV